jgi:hypothetical protein
MLRIRKGNERINVYVIRGFIPTTLIMHNYKQIQVLLYTYKLFYIFSSKQLRETW